MGVACSYSLAPGICDQGSQPRDLESQRVGSRSAVFSMESGIRLTTKTGSGMKIIIVFWDQGSTFWVKIWDQLRKNIPRYDPVLVIHLSTG